MLSGAVEATLRIAFGVMAGVVFALFIASGVYFGLPATLVVICIGAGVGAYLGLRYGDRFVVWVLRHWNRSAD